jgi:hypothetical protein
MTIEDLLDMDPDVRGDWLLDHAAESSRLAAEMRAWLLAQMKQHVHVDEDGVPWPFGLSEAEKELARRLGCTISMAEMIENLDAMTSVWWPHDNFGMRSTVIKDMRHWNVDPAGDDL